jgi:mRNA interferase MazF
MIRRGDVWFADLDPVRGREQSGRRPVLVVSDDALNARDLVVTVVVGTDARNVDRRYSTNVRVPAAESGLPRDTVFLCFQVRSLDPARFLDPSRGAARRAGALPASRMAEVDRALRLCLGL